MKAPAPPPPGVIQNGTVYDIDINENVKVLSTYNAMVYIADESKKWQALSEDYVSIYCCDNGGDDLALRYTLTFVVQRKNLKEFRITSLTKVKVKDSFVRLNDDTITIGVRFSKLDTASQFHKQLCDLVTELVPYAKVNKKIMRQDSEGSIISEGENGHSVNDKTSDANMKNTQDVIQLNIQTSSSEQTQFKALPHLTLKEILRIVCKTEKIEPDSCSFQYVDVKEAQLSLDLTASQLDSKNIRLFNTKADRKKNVDVKPAEKNIDKKSKFSIFPKKKSEARLTTPEPNQFHFNIEEPIWSSFLHLANLHADELSNSRIIALIETFVKERGGYTYLRQVNDQKMSPQLADDLNTLAGQVHGLGNSPDPMLQRENSEENRPLSPGMTATLDRQRKKKKRAPPPPSATAPNSELNRMSSFDDMNNNPAYQRISDMKLEIKALRQPTPSPGGKRRAPAVPPTKESENVSPPPNVNADPLIQKSTSAAPSKPSDENKPPPVFVPPPPPHEPPPEEVPATPVAPLSPTTMAYVGSLPMEYAKQKDDAKAEHEAGEENQLLSDLDDILEREALTIEEKHEERHKTDNVVENAENAERNPDDQQIDLISKEHQIVTDSENMVKSETDETAISDTSVITEHENEDKPLLLSSNTSKSEQTVVSSEKMIDVTKDVTSNDVTSKDDISKNIVSEDIVSKEIASKDVVSKDVESKDDVSKDDVSKSEVSSDGLSSMQQQLLQLQLQVQQQQQLLLAAGIQPSSIDSTITSQQVVPTPNQASGGSNITSQQTTPSQANINATDLAVSSRPSQTDSVPSTTPSRDDDDQTISQPASEVTKEIPRERSATQPGRPKNPIISKKPPTGLYAKLKARTASTSALETSAQRPTTVIRSFSEQTPPIIDDHSCNSSTKEVPSNVTTIKENPVCNETPNVKSPVSSSKDFELPNRSVQTESPDEVSLEAASDMSRASSERNKSALESLVSIKDENDRLSESIFSRSDEVTISDQDESLHVKVGSDVVYDDRKKVTEVSSVEKFSPENEVRSPTSINQMASDVVVQTTEESITIDEVNNANVQVAMIEKTTKEEAKLDVLPHSVQNDGTSDLKESPQITSPSKEGDISALEITSHEPKTILTTDQIATTTENLSIVGTDNRVENKWEIKFDQDTSDRTEHSNHNEESSELPKSKGEMDSKSKGEMDSDVPSNNMKENPKKKYDPNALVIFPDKRKSLGKESLSGPENPQPIKKEQPTPKTTNIVRSGNYNQSPTNIAWSAKNAQIKPVEQKSITKQSSLSSNVIRNDQNKPVSTAIQNTKHTSNTSSVNPVGSVMHANTLTSLNVRNASDTRTTPVLNRTIHAPASVADNQAGVSQKPNTPSSSARERLIKNIETHGSPEVNEVPNASVNKALISSQPNMNSATYTANVGLSSPAVDSNRRTQTLPVQRSRNNIPVKKEYIFNLPSAVVDKPNGASRKAPEVKAKPIVNHSSEKPGSKTSYIRSNSYDNKSNRNESVVEFPRRNEDIQVERNIRPSDVFNAREQPKKEPPKVLPKRNSVRVKSPEEESEHNVKPSELFGVSKTLPRQFKIKSDKNDVDLRSSAAFHHN